jgi:hypothetical protein
MEYKTGIEAFAASWNIIETIEQIKGNAPSELQKMVNQKVMNGIKGPKQELEVSADRLTNAFITSMQALVMKFVSQVKSNLTVIEKEFTGETE